MCRASHLSMGAFEGNMAETGRMLPTIRRFQTSFDVSDIIVVADPGMFSSRQKEGHHRCRTVTMAAVAAGYLLEYLSNVPACH